MRGIEAAALGAALALGACAGVPVVVTHDMVDRDYYRPAIVNAGARGAALPAAVAGAPLPGVDPAAALAPIHLPSRVNPRGLVLAPDAELRVVLVFNPIDEVGADTACGPLPALQAAAGAPGADEFSVQAVLCAGTRRVSTAIAHGPKPKNLNDPAYAAVVEGALDKVMPFDNFYEPVVP
ncbi:hypothetical protein [Zavarzinia sp.]|uniref:hypothetical protein n=1 Tax=Zavarzinia sp. TaxID=2027920 RepID=UPI0035693680